ncbi:MAG: NAD-dependent epimerase/dehydratase family protein [Thermodesulfobacteriota bacterium]|nr:NAD-dependent epimerase/dehydratase family protein [Thermodesulfobacteriota bacterium]
MKILITGGAGFIGSHLTDRLLARGDSVLVIDNFSTGRRDNLKAHSSLRLVEGTIADVSLVNRLFDEFMPEHVIHAAASYKDPDNWEEDIHTNILGTAVITDACRNHAVKRLVYFQTALCYGLNPTEQPITLNHPIRPEGSSYAISKTAGEQYIGLSGLDYISFRLANAYGPRNISGPLPTFYQRLTNNKPCFVMDTRRDFIFIDDLIEVVLPALDGKGSTGQYHVSSGRDYAIKELFNATVKALGITLEKDVEVRPRSESDAYTILLDPSKTNEDFEWKITTQLETGVKSAIEYYKAFGINKTYTHLPIEEVKK